jgi:hypothetical protein
MLAVVAASPLVASATSAAIETYGALLPFLGLFGFCRFTTMLPMVAGALPVLVTVSPPCTVKVVGPEDLVAVTVHVTVPTPFSTGSLVTVLVRSHRLSCV